MFKHILALLFLATTANAGALQNSDFATPAQITGAGGNPQSQLLQTSNIADSVDTVLLNTQIAVWNAKQPAGNYITSLTNDVTASGPGAAAATVAKIQGTTVSGTTGSGNVVFSSAPAMNNPVVGTQPLGDNSTLAASTAFVQSSLAQLNPAAAVFAASTANIAGTYVNAVSGVCVGDTFTTTSTATFVVDGQTPSVGNRVLFKNQTSSFQDGIWNLTTAAVPGISGAIFTRALDSDSSSDFNSGQIVPIINGTVNAGASYFQTANNTTCNTSAQVWTLFQGPSSSYLSSTLSSANIYVGNASNVATAQALSGDCTLSNTGAIICTKTNGVSFAASATIDTTNASNISSGTLALARGGLNNGTSPTSGQIPIGNAGGTAYVPQTVSQDCTLSNAGVITCTKTNNVAFTASATIDTTNASNISSGILSNARVDTHHTFNSQSGTTYTFVLSDGVSQGGETIVLGSNASTQTYTVPTHASVAFPVGEEIDICQTGAGKITLSPAGGVTLNSFSSNLSTGGQFVCISMTQTVSNTWLVFGNLQP